MNSRREGFADPLSRGLVGKSSSSLSTAVPLDNIRLAGADPVTSVPLHGLSQSLWQQEQVVQPAPLPMVDPALLDLVINASP